MRFETEMISKLEYNATVNQGKLIGIQKEQAYTSYQMALHELNQWLLLEEVYDIETSSLDLFDEPLLFSDENLKNHPLFAYWQAELEVADATQKVMASQFLPKVSAQYGFQKIGNQTGFNSFQLGLSFPLFFNKTKGKSEASKIDAQVIEQKTKAKQAKLNSSFSSQVIQFKQLQKTWNYYKNEAMPLAIEQRNGALFSFKEGNMNYIEFLQNMKNAIDIEINSWVALQQFLESKIQLEYYLTSNQ